MMGKTHIFCGMAAALALVHPETPEACITAVIGGAAGGVFCDIDMKDSRGKNDTLYSRLIAAGIIAAALLTDIAAGVGVIDRIKESFDRESVLGAGIFLILCIIGILQPHRKFTHSAIAMFLYSASVGMIYLPLCVPFAAGFVSHLALDILNKKPILLFWPLKTKVCLGLCYSNKFTDKLLLTCGILATILLLGQSAYPNYHELFAMLGI